MGKDEGRGSQRGKKRALFVCSEQKQSHSRDRGTLADPYRGDRLEVSYGGRRCGGCGCGACCIGHPGREVNGPALKALRSHLHKGTKVGGGSAGRSLSRTRARTCVSLAAAPLTRDHTYRRDPPHPRLKISARLPLLSECSGPPVRKRPLATFAPPPPAAASHSPSANVQPGVKMHWRADLAGQGSHPGLSIYFRANSAAVNVTLWLHSATRGRSSTRFYLSPLLLECEARTFGASPLIGVNRRSCDDTAWFEMSCSCAALGPEVEPVPVCDAASAVSPACIALCVPSGIRSVLDEAEERGKQLLIREPNNKNLTDFLQEKCSYVT